jgi:Galactose oxidase, central domain
MAMLAALLTLLFCSFLVRGAASTAFLTWTQVPPTPSRGSKPPPSAYHGAFIHAGHLFLLGGWKGSNPAFSLDSMWVFDLSEPLGNWTVVPAPTESGSLMGGRFHNAVGVRKGAEFVVNYGGRFSSASSYTANVDLLDLTNGVKNPIWRDFKRLSGGGPSPTGIYSAGMDFDPASDSLLVAGGWRWPYNATSPLVALRTLWRINFDGSGILSWSSHVTSGGPPPARAAAAVAFRSAGRHAVLFGGQNSAIGVLNDIWLLDTNSWTWTNPSQLGASIFTLPVRSGAASLMGSLLLRVPSCVSPGAPARSNNPGFIVSCGASGLEYFITGIGTYQGTVPPANSTGIFDFSRVGWVAERSVVNFPGARDLASAAVWNGALYSFGGFFGSQRWGNAIHRLEVSNLCPSSTTGDVLLTTGVSTGAPPATSAQVPSTPSTAVPTTNAATTTARVRLSTGGPGSEISSSGQEDSSIVTTLGVVLGVFLVILILGIGTVVLMRKRSQRNDDRDFSSSNDTDSAQAQYHSTAAVAGGDNLEDDNYQTRHVEEDDNYQTRRVEGDAADTGDQDNYQNLPTGDDRSEGVYQTF